MPFGELHFVHTKNHGQMPKTRRLITQRFIEKDLARRIVEMVIAPDDMRDAHSRVVHHRSKVIGRHAVRAHDDEVIKLTVLKYHAAFHQILYHRVPGLRSYEAYRRGPTLRRRIGPSKATAIVFGKLLARQRLLPANVELFLRTITIVGPALPNKAFSMFGIEGQPLGLIYRTLIPVQTHPFHPIENRGNGFRRRAFPVSILNPKNEHTPLVSGK